MVRQHPRGDLFFAACEELDAEPELGGFVEIILPEVVRRDRAVDLDAGGESLRYEIAGQGGGLFAGFDRGPSDHQHGFKIEGRLRGASR